MLKRSGPPTRKRRLKIKSNRQRELERLDDLCKPIIWARDGGVCRDCGIEAGGRGHALQVAHIYGKGAYPALRHELDNLILVCQPFHYFWHQNGFGREAADRENLVRKWCLERLGREFMERLDLMAMTRTKTDLGAVRLFLEQKGVA